MTENPVQQGETEVVEKPVRPVLAVSSAGERVVRVVRVMCGVPVRLWAAVAVGVLAVNPCRVWSVVLFVSAAGSGGVVVVPAASAVR